MSNPVEEVIKTLDKDKKEKAVEILRNFENLRIQLAEEIKKRSELTAATTKLQNEIESQQGLIEKNNEKAANIRMRQEELRQKLQTNPENTAQMQEEFDQCAPQIALWENKNKNPLEKQVKDKKTFEDNQKSLSELNEKLKTFYDAQIAASELLNGLNIKGNINSVDLSFVHNAISAPKAQPQPNKLPLQEGEQEKENRSPLGWDGSKRSIKDKNKTNTEPKIVKGSYFKPPDILQSYLSSKQFTVMPSGETWLCSDNTSPKSSYTIENGKVTTTGRSDDSLRKTIEIYMQGETISNGGIKPDFSKMEVIATGEDRVRMLEIARKEYGIGTALNKKNTEQNTFGRTPPKKDEEPPPQNSRPNL